MESATTKPEPRSTTKPKSITIHKMDDVMAKRLEERAAKEGISMNQCVKNILRVALGLDERPDPDWTEELLSLYGTWTAEEAREFEENTKIFSQIDEEMWK